jgi:hypothetical protein
MNIIDKLLDPQLFGGMEAFRDLTSWARWIVFLKALYGLPLDEVELVAFLHHTGRTRYTPPPGGFPEAVAIVGVQSGKSTIAGLLLGDAALEGAPGTYAIGVAQDIRGSMRTLLKYARAPFETLPMFQAEVSRDTADVLELRRGTFLGAYPCRPAAIRGVKGCVMVLDEPAFYISTDGRPTDTEMWRVARGRVAMTGGKIIAISSPYAQSGLLWELHRKHFGQDDSPTLIWQASAPEMNPLLPADYLARMEQDDPDAYRSEVLGEFRGGVSTLFDPDVLQESVDVGVRERPRHPGVTSHGFFDGASGSGKDAAVVTVAHVDGETSVLDCLRVWRPPFNPSGVIAEASDVLRAYGLRECTGDAYAPGFILEAFRANRVTYRFSTRTRSDIYLEALPLFNSGLVRLLDHPDLLRELRGLERRRGASGRDRIDHRPGQYSHDDMANASCGALVLAAAQSSQLAWEVPLSDCLNCGTSDEDEW